MLIMCVYSMWLSRHHWEGIFSSPWSDSQLSVKQPGWDSAPPNVKARFSFEKWLNGWATEMNFPHRVGGFSLKDRLRSSVIHTSVRVERLLLIFAGGRWRWFGHLVLRDFSPYCHDNIMMWLQICAHLCCKSPVPTQRFWWPRSDNSGGGLLQTFACILIIWGTFDNPGPVWSFSHGLWHLQDKVRRTWYHLEVTVPVCDQFQNSLSLTFPFTTKNKTANKKRERKTEQEQKEGTRGYCSEETYLYVRNHGDIRSSCTTSQLFTISN